MAELVIAFDLDGTLLDQDGDIHPRDVEILSRRDGALFIPCTGRPLHSVKRLFAKNGLYVGQPLPLPLVSQNGSLVYLPHERLYIQHTFPSDVQKQILSRLLVIDSIAAYLFSVDGIYELRSNALSQTLNDQWKLSYLACNPTVDHRAYNKFMLISDQDDELKRIEREAQGLGLETSFSLDHVLEINPVGINKGIALQELLHAMSLERSQLCVAGDGGNDLPLFDLSSNSFSPLTSPDLVRSRARNLINTRSEGLFAPILRFAGTLAP